MRRGAVAHTSSCEFVAHLCVPFPRSVQATRRTMQVPLNGDDEYDGGRLLFATRKGLECPARPVDVMVVASPDL